MSNSNQGTEMHLFEAVTSPGEFFMQWKLKKVWEFGCFR